MAVSVPAQKTPYKIRLESGKKYAWCAGGRSANQPFCDGSHSGTGIFPKVFAAQEAREVWLCGCKHTGSRPFCDGTHGTL